MSNLTMPALTITFQQAGSSAVARSQKGTVALILRDAVAEGTALHYTLTSTAQIPAALGTENEAAIRRAFLGNANPPKKVLVYVIGAEETITADSAALTWLATQKFDYLAGPADLTAAEAEAVKTWLVKQRADNHAIYKAVLPETAADSEGVVNFAASGIQAAGETFGAAGYCGRVAGFIAGTPMNQSITYGVLSEVTDINRLTATEMDEAVTAGKLILMHDGEKVKFGRGINSLTTADDDIWKKIKIVECLDMIQADLRLTIQDNYMGKYTNDYDHKQILVTAVTNYLQSLANDALIDKDFSADIDVDAQEAWLREQGTDTSDMSEQDIREANTSTHVFLVVSLTPVDAMEDVAVRIYL